MKTYCLELTGPYACFTRPEMKVERVSYDMKTPPAARACFEAILWKPAIRWHVRKIEVLKPIRWINLRLVGDLEAEAPANYDESVPYQPEEDAEEDGIHNDAEADALYDQAVAIVLKTRRPPHRSHEKGRHRFSHANQRQPRSDRAAQ